MILLLVSAIVSFVSTLILTYYTIRFFRFIRLVSSDVHKKNKPLVPNSAGVPVAFGIISGLLAFIFISIFLYEESSYLVSLFAALVSILIIMFSGFMDDLNTKQEKVNGHLEGKRGLKTWQKPLLTLPAALPLMAIMAGTTTMDIPLIGMVDFGILYPLLIVPIGVVGASNMVNMLGGFNGLEAGMGFVYTTALGIFALTHGSTLGSIIFLITAGALVAILRYNWFPAKILSGDSLTYTLGAIVAVGAILGNMEKAALIVMLPFIIQGVLKFYSKFKLGHFASDLGILQKDGTIKPKYEGIYSLTHLVMRFGRLTEKKIVLVLILIQIVFAIIPFLLY